MPPRYRKNNLKKASREEKASKDLTAKKGTTKLPCAHSKPVKKPRTRCADKLKVANKVKAKIFDDDNKTVIKPITLGKWDGLSTVNIRNDFNKKCVDDTQSEVNNETLNSSNSSPKKKKKVYKDLTAKKGTTELPCVHSKPVKKPMTRCADKLKVASKVKAKIFDDNNKTVIKPITLGKWDGLSTVNIRNDFNKKCVDDTQSEVNNETLNSNNSSPKKRKEKASKDLTAEKGTTELPCVHSKPVKKPRTRCAEKLKVASKVKAKIFDDNNKTVIKPITLGKWDGLSTVNNRNNFNRKCVDDTQSEVHNETLNSNNSSPEKSRLSFNESMTSELSIMVEKYEECSPCKKVKKSVESLVPSSSSESEWEEVEDNLENSLEDYKPNIPEGGVEITLEHPMLQKRNKREFDMAEFIRVQLNRFKKSVQLSIHKVHILCLISHGVYLNNILNSPDLKGMAFSQIPVEMLEIKKNHSKVNIDLIHKIVECFRSLFLVDCNFVPFGIDLMQNLTSNFEMKKANNGSLYNTMFVVFARALGMNVRLCYSLYPLSHKPSNLWKKSKKLEPGDLVSTSFKSEENASVLRSCKIIENTASRQKEKIPLNFPTTSIVSTEGKNDEKELKLNSSKTDTRSSQSYKYSKEKVVTRQQLKRKKKRVSYKISSDESMNNDKDNDGDFFAGEESDDDFQNIKHSSSSKKKKTPKVVRKAKQTERQGKCTNRKILSDDSNDDEPTTCLEANGIEYWAEVYSKAAKRWVPVECSCNIVDEPYILEDVARQPITYILAFDDKSHIKDVTKRYCAEWLTRCRQLRIDLDWWEDTLRPYHPPNNKQNKEEEEQMEKELCRKPLPTTISEFKNHPLYVLSRHLLKFEAIYPSDAPTLGFIKNEPIYARECVHTLRSRETWMKEARVVRVGEEAYKVVKRPKWDKVNRKILKDVPLELFGYWQTEKFVPPTAHGGIVPKNEYGNVELFKSCMLPKGTVHLQLPGLNRIARKLGIDCCPALVGFDIHTRGVHPVFDGWIICKEFKKTMEEAWAEEQVNIKKREVERREKRVYGNWKKLIRGLLIKERIKVKYAIK